MTSPMENVKREALTLWDKAQAYEKAEDYGIAAVMYQAAEAVFQYFHAQQALVCYKAFQRCAQKGS